MTRRATPRRGRGDVVHRALLLLTCVVLALLPFKGALGAVAHPCDMRAMSLSVGHLDPASGGEHAGEVGHDSHAQHPAADIPGAGCATCALHCSVALGFGIGLPLRESPAPSLVALSPVAAPPGLNPAPADPPPRQ